MADYREERSRDLDEAGLATLPGWGAFEAVGTLHREPSVQVMARTRLALADAMRSERPGRGASHSGGKSTGHRDRRTRTRRLRIRRRWYVLAGVVATVSLLAGVLPLIGVGDVQPQPAAAAAADFLRSAADRIPPIGAGRYWRIEVIDWARVGSVSGGPIETGCRVTSWYELGKRAHFRTSRTSTNQSEPSGPADAGQSEDLQGEMAKPVFDFMARSLDWREVAALPSDQARMLEYLRREQVAMSGRARDLQIVQAAINLLGTAPVSAPQRMALYRVLADLPGVAFEGATLDKLGRSGTRLSLIDSPTGLAKSIVITPDGQLLEATTSLSGADPKTFTYVSTGPTDALR